MTRTPRSRFAVYLAGQFEREGWDLPLEFGDVLDAFADGERDPAKLARKFPLTVGGPRRVTRADIADAIRRAFDQTEAP